MGNGVGKGLEVGKEIAWLKNNQETILAKSQDSHRGVLRDQFGSKDWNQIKKKFEYYSTKLNSVQQILGGSEQ